MNYSGAVYALPALQWTSSAFVAPQVMVHDRFLYDRASGLYTVSKFLEDVAVRYGGVDAVLLWHSYPNIGVDARSQYDMLTDMPGGVAGVKAMVAEFNAAGVAVGFPENPWDTTTARRAGDDPSTVAELWKSVGATFVNGDTMSFMDAAYFNDSLALGNPLALQPEGGPQPYSLAYTKMGWAYWDWAPVVPPVDFWRFVEPRHMTQMCDRWASNHTTLVQLAWFNGAGWVSWENVWGIWLSLSARDSELSRRFRTLSRFFAGYLTSPAWQPHAVLAPGAFEAHVHASAWPDANGTIFTHTSTLFTIVNRGGANFTGPTVLVPCGAGSPPAAYFDVYHGLALTPAPLPAPATGCALTLAVEAGGISGVLAMVAGDVNADLAAFLADMGAATAVPLAAFATDNPVLPQTMADNGRTTPATSAPPGMVHVPQAANWQFVVSGIEIEGGDRPGVDVAYPFEAGGVASRNHNVTLPSVGPFYIDAYPVTNARYAAFLASSGFWPADAGAHNFLLDWACSPPPASCTFPPGWDKKPVTWVAPEEAAAFCDFTGGRLPNEWEWQLAAQGTDGRAYPWGPTFDASLVPAPAGGPAWVPPDDVDAHPGGASPYGLMDAVGNVWQWTNVFQDDHTMAAVVRGGGRFRANSSEWYFPRTYRLDQHGKYLLMAPSMDRRGGIGFRCLVDAAA